MNDAHLRLLASPEWAERLEHDLLPWLEEVADLGDDVLEVGPGPGLTTNLLRQRTTSLTAVEVDADLASALTARLAGTNVEVLHRDATDTGLTTSRFSAATCFSMLHHMPSPEHQDRLFAELHRVLRPSGVLTVTDAVDHELLRQFHEDDVFVPVDPATVEERLTAAGFRDVHLDVGELELRFHAMKPPVA